jgi:MFS family permease
VFAEKVLGGGPMILGLLWSAYGGGMVLISAWLAFAQQRNASQRLLIIIGAMAVGGAASFLLAGSSLPFIAMGLVTVIGAGLASFTPITWGLLQEITPEPLRGRVFGIFNTAAMSASMIGMVAFGWGTDKLGPHVSLLAMAGILWLTGCATVALWRFGNLSPAK